MGASEQQAVVIRRVKKVHKGGHHGGAWKVAYADFVTAMMAFFMVMWIVGISDQQQRAAISEYFNNPSMTHGQSTEPAAGANGPGGASTSMIELGGALDKPRVQSGEVENRTAMVATADSVDHAARELDRQRLEELRKQLLEAIAKSEALAPFKNQLLLDLTREGLRIQIVDEKNRPMFDVGGAHLKTYTSTILHELAGFIESVPNSISISGHTDVTQYGNDRGYTNWELSTDRANAARRELVAGGMSSVKVTRIVGLGSTVLFDREHPTSPINRRISIVVMNQDAMASTASLDQTPETAAGSGGATTVAGTAHSLH